MEKNLRYEVQDITPELAAKYLERNTNNRPLRKSHVAYLAHEMIDTKARKLEPHPSPIIFDENGVLLDGQHRLHAIIALGMPVKMIVEYGFHEDIFGWIDGGVGRSMADRTDGSIPRYIVPVVRTHMDVRASFFKFRMGFGEFKKLKPSRDQYLMFYSRLEPNYRRVESIAKRYGCFRNANVFAALTEMSIINDGATIDFIDDMHKILDADKTPRKPHASAIRDVLDRTPRSGGRSDIFLRIVNVLRRYLKNQKPLDGKGKPADWLDPDLKKVRKAILGDH